MIGKGPASPPEGLATNGSPTTLLIHRISLPLHSSIPKERTAELVVRHDKRIGEYFLL